MSSKKELLEHQEPLDDFTAIVSVPAVTELVKSNSDKLMASDNDIADRLTESFDADEVKKLVALFNVNQTKKDVLRVIKLNSLVDKVDDEMTSRITLAPEELSNQDLISYGNITQQAISKSRQSMSQIDATPLIQLNQTNISMDKDEMSRESRDKVIATVNEILNRAKQKDKNDNVVEADFTDKQESK